MINFKTKNISKLHFLIVIKVKNCGIDLCYLHALLSLKHNTILYHGHGERVWYYLSRAKLETHPNGAFCLAHNI